MGDVTLLSSVTRGEQQRDGFTVTKVSGDSAAAAIVGAVCANYHRILNRHQPNEADLQELVGEKVTLTIAGANMLGACLIVAREGRLFDVNGHDVAILPKGKRSKGYRVDPNKVLDVLPDWVADEAGAFVDQVVGHYPQLRNLTQERLAQLPRESGECSLAVFGHHPLWGASDCLWLIGEYWPEDDICDTNVLLVRPEFATSEAGSCYGRDLLSFRAVGEVVGFEPIPFSQALDLCNDDFDYALAHVFRRAVPA